MNRQIEELAHGVYDKLVDLRRHFHRHPELSYHEFNTTQRIVEELEPLGYEVHRPLETGCIAVLKGGVEADRVLALRADIDALPMEEEGDYKADFLSQVPGVAHCCGHDLHTANLLGVAHILSSLQEQIPGTVVLIFQPGEEKPPGGARLLMETGLLQRLGVQAIYGLHSYPYGQVGEVSLIKGPMMARPDEFVLKVIGKGGHAAIPQKAIDPVVISAQIITVIQSIVSRSVNPLESAVVTIGKIAGGTVCNVIPDSVIMLGTIRSFSEELSERISRQIEQTATGIANAAGASIAYELIKGYPAVVNTPWAVDALEQTAAGLPGVRAVPLAEPIMAGEDFAFYQQEFPGSYMYLGTGSPQAGSDTWNWHHPCYNTDERAMITGMCLMAALVFNPKSTQSKS
ncbi:MAG: amidohydrolase [Bacteroidetes bacterium]|nr:amidohydrolase [Bacteroidota bacterium]